MKTVKFKCSVCGSPIKPGDSFKLWVYASKAFVVCCPYCLNKVQHDPAPYMVLRKRSWTSLKHPVQRMVF